MATPIMSNPLREDAMLRDLLSQLDALESHHEFGRWKQSFLNRFKQFLDQQGSAKAEARYKDLGVHMVKLTKTLKTLDSLIMEDKLTPHQASVKARQTVAALQQQLTNASDKLSQLIPGTAEEAGLFGFSKFHIGAVLVQDHFGEYDRLYICDQISQRLSVSLENVVDKQVLLEMKRFGRQLENFCAIMADLGLYEAMIKCHELKVEELERIMREQEKANKKPQPSPPPPSRKKIPPPEPESSSSSEYMSVSASDDDSISLSNHSVHSWDKDEEKNLQKEGDITVFKLPETAKSLGGYYVGNPNDWRIGPSRKPKQSTPEPQSPKKPKPRKLVKVPKSLKKKNRPTGSTDAKRNQRPEQGGSDDSSENSSTDEEVRTKNKVGAHKEGAEAKRPAQQQEAAAAEKAAREKRDAERLAAIKASADKAERDATQEEAARAARKAAEEKKAADRKAAGGKSAPAKKAAEEAAAKKAAEEKAAKKAAEEKAAKKAAEEAAAKKAAEEKAAAARKAAEEKAAAAKRAADEAAARRTAQEKDAAAKKAAEEAAARKAAEEKAKAEKAAERAAREKKDAERLAAIKAAADAKAAAEEAAAEEAARKVAEEEARKAAEEEAAKKAAENDRDRNEDDDDSNAAKPMKKPKAKKFDIFTGGRGNMDRDRKYHDDSDDEDENNPAKSSGKPKAKKLDIFTGGRGPMDRDRKTNDDNDDAYDVANKKSPPRETPNGADIRMGGRGPLDRDRNDKNFRNGKNSSPNGAADIRMGGKGPHNGTNKSASHSDDLDEEERKRRSKILDYDLDEANAKREKCWMWYARLGQPNKEKMKRMVRGLPPSCDIVEDDVDLLPWIWGDRCADVKAMTELIAGDLDELKEKHDA